MPGWAGLSRPSSIIYSCFLVVCLTKVDFRSNIICTACSFKGSHIPNLFQYWSFRFSNLEVKWLSGNKQLIAYGFISKQSYFKIDINVFSANTTRWRWLLKEKIHIHVSFSMYSHGVVACIRGSDTCMLHIWAFCLLNTPSAARLNSSSDCHLVWNKGETGGTCSNSNPIIAKIRLARESNRKTHLYKYSSTCPHFFV